MKLTHWIFTLLFMASTVQAQFAPVDPLPEDAVRISGGRTDGMLGNSVKTIGDMNGDGHDDFAVAAPQADIVYIIFGRGNLPRTVNLGLLGTNGFPILGEVGTNFGATIAALGDVNRDGRADLAIGAPFAGEGGKIYVMRGDFYLSTIDITDSSRLLYTVEGEAGENLGSLLFDGGDINNDGFSELLIPSPSRFITMNGETSVGASYIIYGGISFNPKVMQTNDLDPENTLTLFAEPTRSTSSFGIGFDLLGDFMGDGFPDVVLVAGINVEEDITKNDLLVFSGIGKPRGVQMIGETEFPTQFFSFKLFDTINENKITQIGSSDLDGDGLSDLVLGYPFANPHGDSQPAGSIAIVPGSTLNNGSGLIDRTKPVTFITTNLDNALFGNKLSVLDNFLTVGMQDALNPLDPNSSTGLVYLFDGNNLDFNVSNIAEDKAKIIFIGKKDASLFGASVDLTHLPIGSFVLAGSPGDQGEDTNDDGFPDIVGTGAYLLPTDTAATGVNDFQLYD